MRRISKVLGATVLALVTASACSSPGAGFASAQPSLPAVVFGATAPPASQAASSGKLQRERVLHKAVRGRRLGCRRRRDQGPAYLIVGVAADQYLTGYLGADGVEQGFDIDLAHAIAQALFGNPNAVQFVAISTDKRIPDLQAHTVDMVIDTMTITCDRLSEVGFSAVYYDASQKLLVEKGSGYKSLADLGGKNVCAQSGSTSISLIQHAASKPVAIQVTDISDCLVLLEENKVSAISTDDTILAGLAQQDPNLEVLQARWRPSRTASPCAHGATDLEGYVNGVLAHYEADGGWAAAYSHWFAGSLGAANPPSAQYSK